jgi:type II secretory pathway pseudopilin PulG
MVELLVVLGIIALLIGLLLPALSAVKNVARETKQKAQFTAIELALIAFKNDHGDYPPSDRSSHVAGAANDYCGAQKLAEALLGWDLLGFHPKTAWRADGLDVANGPGTYDPLKTRDLNSNGTPDTLDERKEPYLELATTSAFKLIDLFRPYPTGPLAPDPYVICDVFTVKKVTMLRTDPVANRPLTITEKAGSPVLYYKANASSKRCEAQNNPENNIYNILDNQFLMDLGSVRDRRPHPLSDPSVFYSIRTGPTTGILDPRITARPWPYRPDSYILISAGADGLYGTSDDICNFGN